MSVVPIWVKSFATSGPGLSKEKPLECGTYPNPHVATSPTADPEFAYQMAKLLVELYLEAVYRPPLASVHVTCGCAKSNTRGIGRG